MDKILIVDDDTNICEMLSLFLLKENYEVESVNDGEAAITKLNSYSPDLILLDIMLPKKDGWTVCREIREFSSVPVIMITAKGETYDKVRGLEIGADDFIVKPFDMKELLARIRAVLRRYQSEPSKDNKVLRFDNIEVSIDTFEMIIGGKNIPIPRKELELFYFLASNPDHVFTRDQLLDKVWGFDYLGDSRTVDVHVKRLREKVDGVSDKWAISTVWGVGYKFQNK